jgi:protein-disulfide isomerase
VNVADLHAPGQLGDKVLGSADAPVTVIEYASMTCPHCARFDRETFDSFRLAYVDSGKVRYVFREFPVDAPGFAIAMIARCAPADRFFDVVHTYFRTRETWLAAGKGGRMKAALAEVAEPFGLNAEAVDACISNDALFGAIQAVKTRGQSFGVRGTPTFFINGKKIAGALRLDQLAREIDPLLMQSQ